ncbi:MAG: restriction endonuclease [Candidatus Shapirobacteria bacterium]|jgi:HJR/Mrr/RecB family endonuclease/tetrahydromethanopterin S-methyltransferase subunit G
MHYYRKPKKFTHEEMRRSQEEIEERDVNHKILKYQKMFGEDFQEPKPEDCSLDSSIVEVIEKYNKKVDSHNKKNKEKINTIIIATIIILYGLIISLIIFTIPLSDIDFESIFSILFLSLFIILPLVFKIFGFLLTKILINKNFHQLTAAFNQYIELKESYPGKKEIAKLIEKSIYFKKRKQQKDYWFSLNGHEFEEQITKILKKYNYKDVFKTKGSGDGGVDIIVTKNDGQKIFIQCKAHKKQIGPETVRALFGVMNKSKVSEGIVIGLGGFSPGAIEFAQDENIKLLDINDILEINKGTFTKNKNEK